MRLTGKKVAILGAGRSGRAAARLVLRLGGHPTIYGSEGPEAFDGLDQGIESCPAATVSHGAESEADLVVLSPGIVTDSDFVKAFTAHGAELIGEIELAFRVYEGEIVAITGTNGKTTVTELISSIINASGRSCLPCGNYGVPFSEVLLGDEVPEVVSLELSSFQLETIDEFHPKVSLWLNFAADHMDRYGSLDEYKEAKLQIFKNQTSDDQAIVRLGEDLGELQATRTTFSAFEKGGDYTFEDGVIKKGENPLVKFEETKMRGLHNAENIMAAVSAAMAVGVTEAQAVEAVKNYTPPAHRCEFIREFNGVEYLNDSKATNLHALESAIRSQSRPIVLIAGGKEKGLDYAALLPSLQGRVIAAVTIGEIGDSLAKLLSQEIPATNERLLAAAVAKAKELAPQGATVLFSPGTSSFDQFSGYETRGDAFRELVHLLD